MGTKRVGLARTEALLENLKREIVLGVGSSLAGGRRKVETVTNSAGAIALVLTEAAYPSNTLFALDIDSATNDVAITLPAVTAGLEYTFHVQTTAGTNVGLTLSGPGAVVQGVIVCDDGTADGTGTNMVFADTKAIAGTRVHFLCDGVKWNVVAHCLCDLSEVAIS
tara:strand:+ start:1832 stop:2329 length:498 start_codon:yes stop_codon:yes gene_type:complete